MTSDEVADESSPSWKLTPRSFGQEVQQLQSLILFRPRPILELHICFEQGQETHRDPSIRVALKDLPDIELFDFRFLLIIGGSLQVRFEEVCILEVILANSRLGRFEPKFLVEKPISQMSSFHILVDQGHRNDEIKVKSVDDVGNHTSHDSQSGILKVSDRYVHRSELDSPADPRFQGWGNFKAQ